MFSYSFLQLEKTEAQRTYVTCLCIVDVYEEPWHSGSAVWSSVTSFFFLFFVYFSFPKFHPSVLLSSLFLYLLYKGHHWIPWSRLLTRVHKFDFLCQLATVFSSVYQLTCMDLPNLLNPNKSQTEFIFPKSFLSSCLLLENFIIHQHVKYQNLLFVCSSSVQFGSVQSLSHV